MNLFGLTIARTKTLELLFKQVGLSPVDGGWHHGWWPWPLIHETSPGGWQRNEHIHADVVLRHPTVYACITLIQEDIGKMRLRLMEETNGIFREVEKSAYSPVLRKPNVSQTRQQFLESWINSKLVHGNTYVWKLRDLRGVVTAMYVLDPMRVKTLIAPDGSIFYELEAQDFPAIGDSLILPAREIIHDRISPLFHQLIGVSPLYAAASVALHGLNIMDMSSAFFANGARPGGVIEVPGAIKQESIERVKSRMAGFKGTNSGDTLVLADGMKYTPVPPSKFSDAQLAEQINWIDEKICSVFHVPPHKVGVGNQPNYNNIEALNQQYWSECLQKFAVSIQLLLVEGLNAQPYDIQFDLNDLLRMDTQTKVNAAAAGIKAGFLAPNEARQMFFDLPPVEGGETPYLQQQDFSLGALARRDEKEPAPPSTEPDVKQVVVHRESIDAVRPEDCLMWHRKDLDLPQKDAA